MIKDEIGEFINEARRNNDLDDCTCVAPKGKFKANSQQSRVEKKGVGSSADTQSLSSKEVWVDYPSSEFYYKEDVRLAIQKLKENLTILSKQGYLQIDYLIDEIDRVFGSKLC